MENQRKTKRVLRPSVKTLIVAEKRQGHRATDIAERYDIACGQVANFVQQVEEWEEAIKKAKKYTAPPLPEKVVRKTMKKDGVAEIIKTLKASGRTDSEILEIMSSI